MLNILIGITIPFIGTVLGASAVFFLRKQISLKTENILLGFAAGVMIAASVWSLLIPAIEMSGSQGNISWFAPAVGFLIGILVLLIIKKYINKFDLNIFNETNSFKKRIMLITAVTLHNIPEGMAVGVVFGSILSQNTCITLASAVAVSIGIAVQNFPEGAIISMPLKTSGASKKKSFFIGAMSGIVEPISAIITVFLTKLMTPILPYILAFAAGSMIFVSVSELIPESQNSKYSNIGIIGLAIGFVLMMILDVALN